MLIWGNAIPDSTWKPCFDFLESIGMKQSRSATSRKRRSGRATRTSVRADDYVDEVLRRMWGFRIPFFGRRSALEARQAMLNFYRNPGTRLYDTMVDAHRHVQGRLLPEAGLSASSDVRRYLNARLAPRRRGSHARAKSMKPFRGSVAIERTRTRSPTSSPASP